MRIGFRCDANSRLGSGHLRRCAVLAEEAIRQDHQATMLLCTDGNPLWPRYLPEKIEAEIKAEPLDAMDGLGPWIQQSSPDLIVVDHYELMRTKAKMLSEIGVPWMMFDNGIGTHQLHANLIHNALPGYDKSDYQGRLGSEDARLLLGPAYALIRPEFRQAARRSKEAKTVVVQFGGGSDFGMILRVIHRVAPALPDWRWNIFTTSANENLPVIRQAWQDSEHRQGINLFVDEPQMADHFAEADLAISAAGTTLFELAWLGVPAVVIALAENQMISGQKWAETGAVEFMGRASELSDEALREAVAGLAADAPRREGLARKVRPLVDGNGAERTVAALSKYVSN